MAMKRIELTIDRNGQVNYETKGVPGSGCMQETEWLDELFGKDSVQSTEKTSEFHRQKLDLVYHRGNRRG